MLITCFNQYLFLFLFVILIFYAKNNNNIIYKCSDKTFLKLTAVICQTSTKQPRASSICNPNDQNNRTRNVNFLRFAISSGLMS